MNINELLTITAEKNASDLHISTGMPPIIRIDGELIPLEHHALSADAINKIAKEIMREKQWQIFNTELEFDFAYALSEVARFRVNTYQQQRGPSIAFRTIPHEIPSFADLGFENKFEKLCELRNGIVIVTGPTGSGKSTTLATMINHINKTQNQHILTIEDPVEFTYTCKESLIDQREVNRDTKSFSTALRSALREDPDVILVGEMRDLETIRLALTAAETGHLVFTTLHTNSAATTIDRIIDVFPMGEKDMIRAMLSESLRAVISQTLLKRKNGGRIAAQEIMVCTPAIRNLIRENKIPQIYTVIQTGQAQGMHTLEQHIESLIANQLIDNKYLDGYSNLRLTMEYTSDVLTEKS